MKHLLLWTLAVLAAVCVKAQNNTGNSAKPQLPDGDEDKEFFEVLREFAEASAIAKDYLNMPLFPEGDTDALAEWICEHIDTDKLNIADSSYYVDVHLRFKESGSLLKVYSNSGLKVSRKASGNQLVPNYPIAEKEISDLFSYSPQWIMPKDGNRERHLRLHINMERLKKHIKNTLHPKENNTNATEDTDVPFVEVGTPPTFPDGEFACRDWIKNNIDYSEAYAIADQQPVVYAQVTVNTDGSISDISILDSPNERLAETTIKLIEKMPKWLPGSQEMEPKRERIDLPPIQYYLTQPFFHGGDAALAQYIKEHVDMSQLCPEDTAISIEVTLKFNKKGEIKQVIPDESVKKCAAATEAVVNALKDMPA